MANPEHLAILEQGVKAWNEWREQNPGVEPDLSRAALRGARLEGANLGGADLDQANLIGADLTRAVLNAAYLERADLAGAQLIRASLVGSELGEAVLTGADLSRADLRAIHCIEGELAGARLAEADLSRAVLQGADLRRVDLTQAILREADLSGAYLSRAMLIHTDLAGANLSNCWVYGISAWDLNLTGAIQQNLLITPSNQPSITVDNLEVAQFIYLLLNNERIRDVVDTITSKTVLILGRFTPERKVVLDRLREELRQRNYLPILFDFDKPVRRDTVETISTLAHMARFVIADLTAARSVLQELQAVVPNLPSVPVQSLLHVSDEEPGMFDHFRRYPWVLPPYQYASIETLVGALAEHVIGPAEAEAKKRTGR